MEAGTSAFAEAPAAEALRAQAADGLAEALAAAVSRGEQGLSAPASTESPRLETRHRRDTHQIR